MAHTPEEIEKSVKKYLWIGGLLALATCATVALSYVEMPTHGMNIIAGMILAAFKASLVGLFFMHLIEERKLIYKILIFTGVFALALFVLFYVSHENPLVFDGFYLSNQE